MNEKTFIIIILLILVGGLIMTGIVHERIVASRDKGLAVDWNADHEITGDVDMDQHSWKNQVIENLGAFPAGPVEGQVVYRADENKFYIYDGAAWITYLDANNYTDYVAIPHGTYYWSCTGDNFLATQPDINDVGYSIGGGWVMCSANVIWFVAPVFLPHGAVVTGAIVYGNINDETWGLRRVDISAGTGVLMANANFNTQDNTIANATIDNNNYGYFFSTSDLDDGDRIYGARIIYTL